MYLILNKSNSVVIHHNYSFANVHKISWKVDKRLNWIQYYSVFVKTDCSKGKINFYTYIILDIRAKFLTLLHKCTNIINHTLFKIFILCLSFPNFIFFFIKMTFLSLYTITYKRDSNSKTKKNVNCRARIVFCCPLQNQFYVRTNFP